MSCVFRAVVGFFSRRKDGENRVEGIQDFGEWQGVSEGKARIQVSS